MAEEKTVPEKEKKQTKPKQSKQALEIEKLKEENKSQKELLLRTAAEFDNYKKRTEREKESFAEFNKAQTVKMLLPIFDNVDRALAADKESAEYQKGIELIVKQLNEAVEKLGLKAIGENGETFNPEYHEAVMHIEDENLPENSIAEVLQKGYMVGETVVRPAMVKVAN